MRIWFSEDFIRRFVEHLFRDIEDLGKPEHIKQMEMLTMTWPLNRIGLVVGALFFVVLLFTWHACKQHNNIYIIFQNFVFLYTIFIPVFLFLQKFICRSLNSRKLCDGSKVTKILQQIRVILMQFFSPCFTSKTSKKGAKNIAQGCVFRGRWWHTEDQMTWNLCWNRKLILNRS